MSYFGGIGVSGYSKPYQGDAFAAVGLGTANFINGMVIRHPFIVLRRQCQIHDHAQKKHLLPTTLVPIIFKLAANDGPLSLWKGAVGSGVLWAFSRLSELVIAELFGLPKTYIPDGSSERFWRHIWLKMSNFFFCTPVIVASFIETIRSGTNLTDDLQILEVLNKGLERLSQDLFSSGSSIVDSPRRRHALFWLALPTSLYQISHFLICHYVYGKTFAWTRAYVSRKMPSERKRYHTIMPELFTTMTSVFIADIACYPLETVLHRLYVQGTRTLVDNLDTGTSAFVPAGRYTGVFDCFTSIVNKEGISALFSGVGAVLLQYMLQHCVAGLVYWALDRGSRGYTSGPLRIKTNNTEFPRIDSNPTSFGSPFAAVQLPQNPSAQFAASTSQASAQAQTSGSALIDQQSVAGSSIFPTFAQTQQRDYQVGQHSDDNPFIAALRQRKSVPSFGSLDNGHTDTTTTNNSINASPPYAEYRHH